MMRTDSHRNPTAFTTRIAAQAGLSLGLDYEIGDPFQDSGGRIYSTARLLGDPIVTTIRVIDSVGFYAQHGGQRWNYIAMPREVWLSLSPDFKAGIISGMYNREGGTEMVNLFQRRFLF